MEILGFELTGLILNIAIAAVALAALLTIAGLLLVWHFSRTGKMLFPRLSMAIINVLETPIRQFLWLFNLDEHTLFLVRMSLTNLLYRAQFAAVPFAERAVFLPQCLRHQECPANSDYEGLHCKSCGKCEVCRYKKETEKLGYRVFIAPGGTMVKRMITKYKPKAVLGIGCENEVQMGAEMAIRNGVVPQGVPLSRSGCINTLVDWDEVRKITNYTPGNVND